MARESSFVEVSKKTKKIDKTYLDSIDAFINKIKQKKRSWVAQVSKEPKLFDAYDSLRLSLDILENYKSMVATAGPNDNPKVIDYALPTLEVVEGCLEIVNEIDSQINQKNFDAQQYKNKAKKCSMQLQEIGKTYLTDFDVALQKIPKSAVNQAVSVLNEKIGQDF